MPTGVSGHYGDPSVREDLDRVGRYGSFRDYAAGKVPDRDFAVMVQADGDELAFCCNLLARPMPPTDVYRFVGDNAREIVLNWPDFSPRKI